MASSATAQNATSRARAHDLMESAQAEHPILFSDAMVRAILKGTKTQTRRALKVPKGWTLDERMSEKTAHVSQSRPNQLRAYKELRCPYGRVGDRLWVRECWCEPEPGVDPRVLVYRADLTEAQLKEERAIRRVCSGCVHWRPSIFMSRWASRITLEVTEVRVQRLQDISDEDIAAEGVTSHVGEMSINGKPATGFVSPQYAFACLWNSINGKREGCTWGDNPWVWAISFKREATP